MSTPNAQLVSQLRDLARSPPTDRAERQALQEAARELSMALETSQDGMHRVFWSAAQLPMTQIGVDMGIFRLLASEPERGFTVREITTAYARAEEDLVYRVVRYLASFALIEELEQTQDASGADEANDVKYRANAMTTWLATPGGEGGVTHFLKTITPVFQALPDVLKETDYRNPRDGLHTAFQKAHNTTAHGYSWIPTDNSLLTAFFTFLQSQQRRPGQIRWTDVFSLPDLSQTTTTNRIFMIDLGGGTGPQSILARSAGARGRIILQDQPAVLAQASAETLAANSIEAVPHDFLSPQPAVYHGAKIYFLKNIMHDWPDAQCKVILGHVVAAMAADSLVLIHDCVLPNVRPTWRQTQMDVQMMAALAAVERSEVQWKALLEGVGLSVSEVLTLGAKTGSSLIVARRA